MPARAETLRYAQGDSLVSFFPSEMRCAEDSARCWFTQHDRPNLRTGSYSIFFVPHLPSYPAPKPGAGDHSGGFAGRFPDLFDPPDFGRGLATRGAGGVGPAGQRSADGAGGFVFAGAPAGGFFALCQSVGRSVCAVPGLGAGQEMAGGGLCWGERRSPLRGGGGGAAGGCFLAGGSHEFAQPRAVYVLDAGTRPAAAGGAAPVAAARAGLFAGFLWGPDRRDVGAGGFVSPGAALWPARYAHVEPGEHFDFGRFWCAAGVAGGGGNTGILKEDETLHGFQASKVSGPGRPHAVPPRRNWLYCRSQIHHTRY